eukprot:6295877-Pyramimonas_sp.AAC.1
MVYLFGIGSGIIQGCPGGGPLYAVTTDCALLDFQKHIGLKQRGEVKACADDIGATVKRVAVCGPTRAHLQGGRRRCPAVLEGGQVHDRPAQWPIPTGTGRSAQTEATLPRPRLERFRRNR